MAVDKSSAELRITFEMGVEIRLGLFHLLDKVSVYCCMIK